MNIRNKDWRNSMRLTVDYNYMMKKFIGADGFKDSDLNELKEPFSASWFKSSGLHRKRPSPWEMGTLTTSPTWTRLSQGERLEATRVRTILD